MRSSSRTGARHAGASPQGTGVHFQNFTRVRAHGFAQGVSVAGRPLQSLQNEHIQGALEDLRAILVAIFSLRHFSWYVEVLPSCR